MVPCRPRLASLGLVAAADEQGQLVLEQVPDRNADGFRPVRVDVFGDEAIEPFKVRFWDVDCDKVHVGSRGCVVRV